jgi:hypothetical protein
MLPGSLSRSSLVMIALWRVDEVIMQQVLGRGISFCPNLKSPTIRPSPSGLTEGDRTYLTIGK